ncbi:hypothetical protein C8Q77DRAFT_1140521, partial [Trametes polyzona]
MCTHSWGRAFTRQYVSISTMVTVRARTASYRNVVEYARSRNYHLRCPLRSATPVSSRAPLHMSRRWLSEHHR